jgi:hypothetical protein
VTLDNSCVLLWWLCTTGGDSLSLDSSCVLLRWMCSTSGGCVALKVVLCYIGGCIPLAEAV